MKQTELSDFELKIIQLICEQNRVEVISKELSLPIQKVKEYEANIQKKIDAKSEVGIVVYAIKNEYLKFNEKEQSE